MIKWRGIPVFPFFYPHEGAAVSLIIIRRMKLFRIERTMKWKNSFFVHFQVSLLMDWLEMRRNYLCIFSPCHKFCYSCMIAAISWVLPLTKYSHVVCMSFSIIMLVDFIQSFLCFIGTYCLDVFLLQEHNNFINCWSWAVIFSTCFTEFGIHDKEIDRWVWVVGFQIKCYKN